MSLSSRGCSCDEAPRPQRRHGEEQRPPPPLLRGRQGPGDALHRRHLTSTTVCQAWPEAPGFVWEPLGREGMGPGAGLASEAP